MGRGKSRGISVKTQSSRADRNETKGPKRTLDERTRDLAFITQRRLEGKTLEAILAEINSLRPYALSLSTLSVDLKDVRQQWIDQSLANYEKHRLVELERIAEEERMVIAAWERSMKDELILTSGDGGVSERIRNRDGNPAFLLRLESIRERRCRILGFASHQKSNDVNAAIQTLISQGYQITIPDDALID